MDTKVRVQLSVMMFLEFFIWGAWFVTMGTYLSKIGFQGSDIGNAYSTTAWAAIISPFFVGMIADKFFSAQKVLAIAHIIGGGALFYASTITDAGTFFWVLLLYTLCFMPTLALTNAISFQQMSDTGKEFPKIRVLGTIGWIAAGWMIALLKIEDTSIPMRIAASASIALGVFSLSLPKTPPKSAGEKITISDIIGLKALSLMKERSFAIFAISSLLICIPLSFYYNFTNLFLNESSVSNAAGIMTFGQMSELFFMLLMPFFFARLGVKKMILTGMLFWAARYVLFAFGNNSNLVFMFYLGILFHGICYDFFFVTGQIYVDKKASEDIRASAQGFIAFITLGLGTLIGAKASGLVVEHYQLMDSGQVTGHLWKEIWIIPAAMAAIVTVAFALLFKDNKNAVTAADENMKENAERE